MSKPASPAPSLALSAALLLTDPADLQADSTFEGDVDNETKLDGGVDPDHRPRKNA